LLIESHLLSEIVTDCITVIEIIGGLQRKLQGEAQLNFAKEKYVSKND